MTCTVPSLLQPHDAEDKVRAIHQEKRCVGSGMGCAVLCCAVLCCAVLCCAVLCCAVLCCVVWCGVVWCGVVWCDTAACCLTVSCRELTPAESDMEFLMIAKDLPRYGRHLFLAKVTDCPCEFCSVSAS